MLRSTSADGQVHSNVLNDEQRSIIPSDSYSRNPDIDVQSCSGESKSSSNYSELANVLRASRRPEPVQESVALQSSASTQFRKEYPVKVCTTSYATSILRGNSWTVQASSSLQNQSQHLQSSFHAKTRPTGAVNVAHSDTAAPVKTGTQYGITASIARPKHVLNTTDVNNFENRWVDEDITRYGSIEENCDDFDEWVERVDVSKFAQDISGDLMSRTKMVKKERNPPIASPYPKPGWSYSNLIALALKNSETGQLTVSEIYAFMLEHFPYFRTAPSGWKNSVRHNLSLNKCFCKVGLDEELSMSQQTRKSCLWMINPERLDKVENDIRKWRERNPDAATEGMARPEDLQAIEDGTKGLPTYRSKKHVLKSVHADKKGSLGEIVYISHPNICINEDAVAADDLGQIVESECQSENDDIVVNQNILISTIKSEHSDDLLSDYFKPSVTEDFMETTFPSTDVLAGTSSSTGNKRQRSESHYTSCKELPVMDLLPSVFVDAFLNMTPPKAKRVDLEDSLSPIEIESGFRHAHDALNDNSLLAAALEQSPYKMPVTFPVL